MAGTAKQVNMCGKLIKLGDKLKVRYTGTGQFQGATIEGTVTELWSYEKDNHLQGRINNGWCFHDYDEIISHDN